MSREYIAVPLDVDNPPVLTDDLLSGTYDAISAASGGPPQTGATPQAEGGTLVWTAILGYYLYLDDGTSQLTLDDGSPLVT